MLTTAPFILGGFALIVLGIYITKNKWRKYRNGTMDKFGVDIQMLALGVLIIILGMSIIGHYVL
jgi:hypothetical protein